MPDYYHSPSPQLILDRMEALLRSGPGAPIANFPAWAGDAGAPANHFVPKGMKLIRSDEPGVGNGNRVLIHIDGDPVQAFDQIKEVWNVPIRCQMLIEKVSTLRKGNETISPSDMAAELLALFTGDIEADAVSSGSVSNSALSRWTTAGIAPDLIYEEHAEVMNLSDEWEIEIHVTFTLRCKFPHSA